MKSYRWWSTRKKATEPGAPQLHEEAPNNIVLEWACGKDADEVDRRWPTAEITDLQTSSTSG